jgi:hypothetical protein
MNLEVADKTSILIPQNCIILQEPEFVTFCLIKNILLLATRIPCGAVREPPRKECVNQWKIYRLKFFILLAELPLELISVFGISLSQVWITPSEWMVLK